MAGGRCALLLGALFTAALPFVEGDAAVWTPRLIATLTVATLLAAAAVVLTWRTRGDRPPAIAARGRRGWPGSPWPRSGVTGLTVVLVLWDAGSDASDVGLVGWAHAAVAVLGYLAVARGSLPSGSSATAPS